MPKVYALALVACGAAACASNPHPALLDRTNPPPDPRTVAQVVNRVSFGLRPGDIERVQSMGIRAYLEEQLHPERIPDQPIPSLSSLSAVQLTAREFATDYYQPMANARQDFGNTQKVAKAPAKLPYLQGHLLPIAAVTL